jgi:DMSO/TMAO reductase YedYZ heme-binding membrane subunit
MTAIAAAGPSAYWYLTRGTGVVALLLLTASVVLGVSDSVRFAVAPRWPRFAIDSLHRDISLLVLVVLAAHIVASVLDTFAPLRLIDAVIPFVSTYRPLWLGLGALSFDLLAAVAITSVLRRRLGYGAWRTVHWLAYASWPVAVLHGLGTGSDTKLWWMLVITVGCVAAVLAAVLVRITRARSGEGSLRAPATALAIATPIGLGVFTLAGPLAPGWAKRAGTPARLLASTHYPASRTAASSASPRTTAGPSLHVPFSARLLGTIRQTPASGGAVIDLALRLSGGAKGRLQVRMAGAPIGNGGLSMTGSQVDLTAVGLGSVMEGRIVSLQGQQFLARVVDASGHAWDLQASLTIDNNTNAVTGTLDATTVGAGG